MYAVQTNRFGTSRRYDLHNLPIAGTMAHKLTGEDLLAAMMKLGIKNINTSMGHQDLALAYANFIDEQKGKS